MKFRGNYFSISEDPFGCEISIHEDEEKEDIYDTGNYLLLQRAYAEEDDEKDSVYLETHDREFCGFLKAATISLMEQVLCIEFEQKKIEVALHCTEEERIKLRDTLEMICFDTIKLRVL